jgi:hypothetical protein
VLWVGCLVNVIRRRAASDPKTDPEGLFPEAIGFLPAQRFASADHRRRALELLNREQSERVPHQNGDAPVTGRVSRRIDRGADAAKRDDESGETQIGLGLSAACREPKQIDQIAVGRLRDRASFDIEQQKGDLKWMPCRGRSVEYAPFSFLKIDRLDRFHPLQLHGAIGELKGLENQRVAGNQGKAAFHSAKRLIAVVEMLGRLRSQIGRQAVYFLSAAGYPGSVLVEKRCKGCLDDFAGSRAGQRFHRKARESDSALRLGRGNDEMRQ